MLRYNQLKLRPGYTMGDVMNALCDQLHISLADVKDLEIIKESIDARKKPEITYSLSVAFSSPRDQQIIARNAKDRNLSIYKPKVIEIPEIGEQDKRPIVIGAGPAGYVCAYVLAKAGLKPLVLERGAAVEERSQDVEAFFQSGVLKPDSNVQFGEGGAGTFSDGKLNTLNKDPFGYQRFVMQLFVDMGADPAILYQQKPHVGTDGLQGIVKNIREEIMRLGGEIKFHTHVTRLQVEEGAIQGVYAKTLDALATVGTADASVSTATENAGHVNISLSSPPREIYIPATHVILAIGHSARDTFLMLQDMGMELEAKPFAVGYRVQHPQSFMDAQQYGAQNVGKFPPAAYKVTHTAKNGRGVYSFCMCPGGYVVNASSEEGRLCVNGMSYHDRAGENANSAIIMSVTPADYPDKTPLSGMHFQRRLEERAYQAGKGKIPMQRYGDFVKNVPTVDAQHMPTDVSNPQRLSVSSQHHRASDAAVSAQNVEITSSITPQMKGAYTFTSLRGILPTALEEAFVEGMTAFDQKMPGFGAEDVLLAGIEARTSSPIRITREDNCQATRVKGLYPCGEGAGYAGGITSAAMDGVKCAYALIEELSAPTQRIRKVSRMYDDH